MDDVGVKAMVDCHTQGTGFMALLVIEICANTSTV
ncbi:uncharacterized protein G2W53_007255 [Senna tora]|uniref:Uncharacterized protein n=1 Tax=Senna tora TaxID=362788 RepID=A0A834X5V1_9FABA|nr:uncharacterized protein G2W53_007255 [Senna tora]